MYYTKIKKQTSIVRMVTLIYYVRFLVKLSLIVDVQLSRLLRQSNSLRGRASFEYNTNEREV